MLIEPLTKKRRIRGGHRTSTKRTLQQVEEAVANHDRGEPTDNKRVLQLRRSLEEKLKILNGLDEEILEMIDGEEALADEIEQADTFKERQGVVTPIGPILTTATAVKNFDRLKRVLTF